MRALNVAVDARALIALLGPGVGVHVEVALVGAGPPVAPGYQSIAERAESATWTHTAETADLIDALRTDRTRL